MGQNSRETREKSVHLGTGQVEELDQEKREAKLRRDHSDFEVLVRHPIMDVQQAGGLLSGNVFLKKLALYIFKFSLLFAIPSSTSIMFTRSLLLCLFPLIRGCQLVCPHPSYSLVYHN